MAKTKYRETMTEKTPGSLMWLPLVLSVALAAGQDANTGAVKEDIPEGASTLAFVFDVTGSMYDDLVQVIEGASKILETSLSRPKRPLYNFALVPFHDPEIGPVTITTDPKKFQYELRELYVQGGGDCPEMSIGAIKIALEISLPGSYIYVFTDARSKDYKLTHEVLQLIQQKQSQVVFVLTGDCDDRTHIGYKVYEEIASTSSGQVFHLDKKQVNEVLKWVEEAVQSSKVHLLSTDHFTGVSNTWQMPFDPSLKEVTVALSGPAPDIEIKNPQGKLVGKSDGLTELLHIPNSAKVVNIKDPQPGMWSIKTASEGRHSVRISGLSTIDFRAGFSRKATMDFKKTSSRPVQGIPTHILLNTTGLSPPARPDRLELLSISGTVIKTLPIRYYPDRQPYNLWNITEFIPPNEAFFLRVTGYDRDGFLFQRVSSVSFSNIVPDAPKVLMPAKTHGYYLQRGIIKCQVESFIPFTLRFSRDGGRLGVDQLFSESDSALWEIAEVTLKDEGYYECIAISSAGTGRARTFLDVSEPPPAVTVQGNVTASPGSRAVLTCHVVSTVSFNLTWLRGGQDARLDPRVNILANLSLQVSAVTPDHSGWYECHAVNEGGVTAERLYLTVQEVPRVSVEPRNQTFTAGNDVQISCSASGYPPPRLVWTHNGMFITASSRHRMTPGGSLVIKNTEKKDGGAYGCLASNPAGTHSVTSILTYMESPVVSVAFSEILIGVGEATVMACSASGIPQPEIWWYKGDEKLRPSSLLEVDTSGGTLTIKETQNADAGDYTCLAVNAAGTASGRISLSVGAAPKFTVEPSDVAVDIGFNVTLPCYARGYPEPEIAWRREDGSPLFNRPRTHGTISQSKGRLQITNLWVGDEGVYICEAQNQFGKIQTQASVAVTGLVSPVIAMSPAVLSVIEDQPMTLPCVLLGGNPLPERQWLHNYGLVTSDQYVSVRRDGSLHIERVRLDDAGDYTCLAENAVGAANHTTAVNVYVIPTIQHGPQVFSTIEGTPISLPCRAAGVPAPDITWTKGGELVNLGGSAFSLNPDGSLLITSPSGNETGEFICTAANAAGHASRKVQLTVYVRPRSKAGDDGHSAGPTKMSVIEGEDAVLPCDVHSVPPPIISWAKERQRISPYSPRHAKLPSGSMKILETRLSDSGLYVCVASNIAGNLTQSIELSILVPPSIHAGPRVMKVQVGHPVELPCVVKGFPKPVLIWTKDGRRYPVSPDGSLALTNVGLDDEGTYTCAATNTAGRDEARVQLVVQVPPVVEVLEPPFNSPLQERVANQRIAFPCPAKGLPKPVIRWLRNGQELTGNEPGVSILEDGTLLILASVSPMDNGEYVCTAANDAGSTERKYQLKVNVPPDFRDRETSGNLSVVLSQPTSLVCDVTGTPTPVVTWYKDGAPVVASSDIQIADMGKTLRLLKAETADAGSYSCEAINVAGNAERSFFLDVLVPPTIIGSGSPQDVSAIIKQAVSLECEVQGIPFPAIQWSKDRKPVFLGDPNLEVTNRGQVLRIKSARLGDQARYQCSATNTAGKQSKDFNLSVYVPPSIKGGNVTTEVTALLDTAVTLECEARGVPLPSITWHRKGEIVLSSRQAQHVERGRYLKIVRAQASDAGQYTCKVTSVAGSAEKSYTLDVYLPPTVTGGDKGPIKRKVVLSKSLILECEAGGHPPPSLTWLKDGVPVRDGASVRVLEQGKKLEIPSAAVSDSGHYICVATSIAGEKEVKYDVRVLVPPFIDGSDNVTVTTVILNTPLELECHSAGTPTPVITWHKDGKLLRQGEGLWIAAGGRRLVISRAQVSDTALFQCVATNEAGNHNKDFSVVVQVPPSIRTNGPTERSVILHKPVSLDCVSSGIPPPTITWLKNGRPVDATSEHLQLESAGRTLKITEARLEDSGKFTCLATNAAGEAQQHIRVSVHEPPSIPSSGETINQTILSGFSTELECKAAGSPLPAITWYKDGRPLTSAAGVTLRKRGQMLEIERAQLSDAGIYRCVAVNLAGAAEISHRLQVLVPPVISSRGGTVTVVVNEAVRLECEATGVPAPSITWLKDGSPVASVSHGIQVFAGGRVLSLDSAQVSDTGRYTCVAVNAGGEQHRDYDLKVYVPPNIKGEEVNATVMLGQPVELHCQSDAVPPPTLSWLKDGRPLFRKPGLTVSADVSLLKISRVHVQDSGRYTCEATNIAGKTEKNYNLNVWVSPSIRGSEEASPLTVVEGSLITLMCESSGIPPPSLTWTKDGSEVKSDQRVRILSGGRQLQISSAEKTDAASYTCTASSAAGTVSKEYSLQVYVSPSIRRTEGGADEVTVIKGGDVTLQCDAEGVPRPAVTWLKDGRPITGQHGAKVLNEGRLLQIKDAKVSDTGRYTCIAVNVAGQADSKHDISVHVPPSIIGQMQFPENVSVVMRNPVALICEASGIPLPTISWLKDGQPIKTTSSARILSGGRSLRLMHAAAEDAGRYTCIVSNSAGEERKTFDLDILVPPSIVEEGTMVDTKVKEKHNITLTCEASGNPVPEIKWLKDGQLLVPDGHYQLLSHGRFLQISGAQVADTGRYSCLASNSAGDRSRHYNLNVLVSPTIAGSGPDISAEEVTVTLSSPTSLVCEVQSYPPALIMWLKDGTPFESSRNVRVLPGGRTLQILNAKQEDAGRYTCVATNEAGETLKHYEVKVYVPPQINKNDIPGEGLAPKEVKIKVNSTLTLECVAQAFPTPALQWYKDGQILQSDDHVSITANGRIVQIKHAQVSDTGRYTCVATNIAGEDEKDFDVNIQVPPNFNRPGADGDTTSSSGFGVDARDVILNNPISLYCETNAVPPPTLTWYKDGHLLTSNDKVLILPGGRVLQIPRAQIEDSGRYTCVAVNEAGEDSIQYDVRVLLPPTIRGTDSDLPDEVTVLVNKTAQLECHVEGTPAPKISWFKHNQPITSNSLHRILSNGRALQILTAQVSDTGRYVCAAENVAGSAEKTFNLNVHVPPTIIGPSSENVTVVVNNFVALSCEATGFPPPTLGWLNGRGPIQANTNALIMPGGRTLQILKAKVSDGGKYSCVALNAAGEAHKHIYLTVFVPPSIRDNSGDSPVVVNVLVGKSVTLECESNAVPPPVITWYKNGRVVTESANLRVLAEGQILEIKGSEVSDTGQYVCMATNVAGQVDKHFHLNIYVPPSIDGPADGTVVETISNPVIFNCDASGIPPPTLTWLKNGRTIENSESLEMHIFSGGSKLQIARSQLSDSGTYTCVASNVEGKAYKRYRLTIQVPPSISGSELPSEMGVLLNQTIQLVCQAQGTPTPTIQWLKDGEAINSTGSKGLRVSGNGSKLTVLRAQTADGGKYTCVATNAAGEEDRIFNLNVYVPPVIVGNSAAAEELAAVLDSSVSIECVATGSPLPQLNWLRNGLPLPVSSHIRLLSAGQVLRVARTQVSDGGRYTCVASNRAGVDNKHYNLQVHVPPGLDGAGSTEDVTVVAGNLASLLCIADGTPTPTVSWLKDRATLVPDRHVVLLNSNTNLRIRRAQVGDTGRYTCVANNTAGEASRHFNLKVMDPPRIEGSGGPAEVSVVVNNVLELHCEATGIPTPSLTWLKDGRPLPQTDSLRLLQGGKVLRVASAQLEDTGRYTCLANSPAGDDDKDFLVRVHVPPNIVGESTPRDVSVLQNRQVTLECKSDAVPPPTLTWLKDGQQLQASARVRVLSGGRYLQINMAELSDRAQYTCVASNIAGQTTRKFNLTVNVAPVIKDGPQSVSVHVNKPAVLECVVSGVPPPQVTWRKHGAILAGNNPRYTFAEDGSLRINSTQVTDTGRYLCMATNQAGTQRKRVDLQVYVPPSIADGRTNVTVIVNVQTTLSCEATGIPKPTVSWRKNGRLINTDQNQNIYRLLSSGSLVVIAPTVEDTAVYQCAASNEAGEDTRSINLTVNVPPSIADELTELVVTRLSPVVIPCTASGIPEPTIHWSKAGMKLPIEGLGYSILATGPIEITSAELAHAGRYSCTAQNAAGSTHRHVQLTVQELPVIESHPSALDVILNNPVSLPCRATGSPTPTITWQKEGINIPTTGGRSTILPNGSLQISKASLSDSGMYICVAQNPAGTALGKTRLRVQVPPAISSDTREYLAPVDSSVTLRCQADGSPPPSVTWHKDGRVLSETVRLRVLSSGSLQIAFIQPSDAGRYTCTAANAAGTVSLEMSLTVQIPPFIRGGEQEVVVVENSQVQLVCLAEGVPQPKLSWEKDGSPVSESAGEYTILPSGELVIDSAQPEDAGSYTCVATNSVGQDSWTVTLLVHTHPIFTELLGDVALNKGERLTLFCGVSGIPLPRITWAFNNNIIPVHYDQTNGHSELVIERVSKDDAGTYTCVAENDVGTIKSLALVYVKEPPIIDGDLHSNRIEPLGGNAILNCEVRGDPLPTIQWSKNGINIQISNRIRQLDNGSLAIYGTVSEDAGNYMCVATNDAGVVERSVTLTLHSAPAIIVEPVETVLDAGTTAVLNCQAEGEPTPMIEWSRQGRPLLGNNRFSALSNGSLRVISAQKEDTAEYECVARNLLGSVLVKVTLTIRVHGGFSEWAEWGPCSVSCGVGNQKRLRQCNNPLPANGGRHCAGSDTETRSCQGKPCPVDGNWSEWSLWEECSRTCGEGNRTRVRTCSSPPPQHGGRPCEGKAVDVVMCRVRPCPVGGNWGSWLPWSPCSETCGRGVQSRIRLCNNPPPAFDGSQCVGTDTQTQMCKEKPCPVDGKWSSWVSWGACSVSCGGGTRQRTRLCASPAPQHGGRQCEGNDVQIDFCNSNPCPISGNWGPWSSWGSCSKTCNGGQMRRYRTCDNPRPAYGGRACAGADTQIQRCSTVKCPVDGTWGSWQPWGECSSSCGGGQRTRVRLCDSPSPSDGGRPCPGDSTQLSRCNTQACPGGPLKARGSIIGNINDVEFGVSILNATITDSFGSRIIKATISNVPRTLGPAMRKLVSILNPVYWTTAHEVGEAVNGYTLTGGIFRRETQVEFATGEILRMTHIVRGLDSDGALLLDIVVSGHILQLPSHALIGIKDYTEDYIQTGPGQLYALSTRMFSIDKESVPYTWNHTVSYDPSKGKMPYLVETLRAAAISAHYHPLEEVLEYSIQASISKGDRSNQCPRGFTLVAAGPYCADENECEVGNPCSHACHNTMGTYYCSCPRGLAISADGRTCQDVDECSLGGNVCHDAEDCENTIGSYRCVTRCGRGFRRTADGYSCTDVNECLESNPCNQRCLNTVGSYRCACEPGFHLRNRRCIDINECRQRVCRSDQQCKNTRGGYICIDLCPSGMTKGGNGTCVDVDECRDGTHQCRYNQICENTRGSYHCTCPRGYRSQGVGRPCVDVNECERLPQPCAHQCINTPGSFKCACPPGRHLLGDGKSCAGLERLPSYESYSYTYRTSQSAPGGGSSQMLYHNLASQSYHSYAAPAWGRYRSRSRRETRVHSSHQGVLACQQGFEPRGHRCLDINECEVRDTCQHECTNTPGSYRCLCPAGYRLMTNGKTCQDTDECLEQNIQCGVNRMCFNTRGSYQCIDTPCPPNYQRDPVTGFCLRNCQPNDLECALSPYALEYKLLSLPFGIAANQDLIRLVAYTQDGVMHPRTSFLVVDEDFALPFALRDENLKGVLFTTRPLREPHTYRMKVRALSYSEDGGIEYQTTFIVYIAVSAYPY
ncbi:hemicentin-1 isoform X1 [Pundamilia nyererei]|uniref:Hemicentin-1 n=1 Tax=Pundamilia nyererei TaxID=303518 RepID=A0A9Y3RE36_9CICH|nr:PREDICTED: hemicentin-1 isoform X1 [Pundamilia nyererei]